MTLTRISDGAGGGGKIVMTVCPLCGHEFDDQANRPWHFYSDHGPGDV